MRTKRCPTCKGTGRVSTEPRVSKFAQMMAVRRIEEKKRTDAMQKKHPSWPRLVCQIAADYERFRVRLIKDVYHISGFSEISGTWEQFEVDKGYTGSDV